MGSGGGIENSGRLTAITSLFANPVGGNLVLKAGAVFVSLGHNLFADKPTVALSPTDLIDTNPMLGPLASNGGPTLTQALLPGSPAINAGVPVPGVTTDQRGLYRPQGAAPDIGAFEVQLPPVALGVQRHGVHDQPSTLVVNFSQPMDPARAGSPTEYHLATRDGRAIRIRSVQYDPTNLAVTILPFRRLPLHSIFRLTILGKPKAGLTDTAGLFLDGAGTGQEGTNYVAVITDKLLVPPIIHKSGK
jgi:hypothetical protein